MPQPERFLAAGQSLQHSHVLKLENFNVHEKVTLEQIAEDGEGGRESVLGCGKNKCKD